MSLLALGGGLGIGIAWVQHLPSVPNGERSVIVLVPIALVAAAWFGGRRRGSASARAHAEAHARAAAVAASTAEQAQQQAVNVYFGADVAGEVGIAAAGALRASGSAAGVALTHADELAGTSRALPRAHGTPESDLEVLTAAYLGGAPSGDEGRQALDSHRLSAAPHTSQPRSPAQRDASAASRVDGDGFGAVLPAED